MRYVVLGLGVSGQAALKFLQKRGEEVTGYDDRDARAHPALCEQTTLVVSPGVPPSHPLYAKALELGIPILGEAELALRDVDTPCVGITGTNGKTTVTLLTTHILNACGKPAVAVGNVGTPLCELAGSIDGKILVVELSSYQLETLAAQVFDAVALLNISPDHLDRYQDFEHYAATKRRIFDLLKPGGLALREEDISNYPDHDSRNLAAACKLCSAFGIDEATALQAAKNFQKPEHRLEFVTEINGISYYNDSKATNIAAVESALRSVPGPCILIAGGKDKGASYASWKTLLREKVQGICTIGEAAPKLAAELSDCVPIFPCQTLEEAVYTARQKASHGAQVLLSPGCSSFDMFTNYAHRGEQFKALLRGLEERDAHES